LVAFVVWVTSFIALDKLLPSAPRNTRSPDSIGNVFTQEKHNDAIKI
jgi:hypothetical protein